MITVNGHVSTAGIPAGCSAPNGHYVGAAVVLTAAAFGWDDYLAVEAAADYANHYADCEWGEGWQDIVDDAERWLNEVTEGAMWLWHSGDFRLVATVECDECGETIDRDDPGTCPDHPWWTD